MADELGGEARALEDRNALATGPAIEGADAHEFRALQSPTQSLRRGGARRPEAAR